MSLLLKHHLSGDLQKAEGVQARTLLVEDDAEISNLISRYLQSSQIEVAVAMESEAMDRALKERAFDLLILDINLPGEDGFSICRRRHAENKLPIIFLTEKGEEVDKR
jgi:two-component system OmpR family response regulator